MNINTPSLEFKGKWRSYQKECLDELEGYLSDQNVHIIAAPGSGKTVLGIEIFNRSKLPVIILTPRISIQEQWISSIENLYLNAESNEEFISRDIENPKFINCFTYQSFAKCLSNKKTVKYMSEVFFNGAVLLLDECHHLTGHWAEKIQQAEKELNIKVVISLTATPPYEIEKVKWERYKAICGEVDAEIFIPELVKAKNLAPHQDFLYVSNPSNEEQRNLEKIQKQQSAFIEKLISLVETRQLLQKVIELFLADDSKLISEYPEEYAATVSIVSKLNISDKRLYEQLLGTEKKLSDEKVTEIEVEYFLKFLFSEKCSEIEPNSHLKTIKALCDSNGYLNDSSVQLLSPPLAIELLDSSKSKLQSIENIIISESQCLQEKMRMLVLTDFIGEVNSEEPPIKLKKGSWQKENKSQKKLTASLIFEYIANNFRQFGNSIALLTGQIIVIPKTLAEVFIKNKNIFSIGEHQRVLLGKNEFLIFEEQGSQFRSLQVQVRDWLNDGNLKVLIGTGSLLGEGWDCPSINSLILASQISSYVTSNQMRGRAIRLDPKDPSKVANIWHLIAIDEQNKFSEKNIERMKKRFEGFAAPANLNNDICSGIQRLSIKDGGNPFLESNNQILIRLSSDRNATKLAWDNCFRNSEKGSMCQRFTDLNFHAPKRLTFSSLFRAKGITSKVGNIVNFLFKKRSTSMDTFLLQRISRRIIYALFEINLISAEPKQIKIKIGVNNDVQIIGGKRKEINLIGKCIEETLQFSEKSRYLISIKYPFGFDVNLYAPSHFGNNRKNLDIFKNQLEKALGPLETKFLLSGDGVLDRSQAAKAKVLSKTQNNFEHSWTWSQ